MLAAVSVDSRMPHHWLAMLMAEYYLVDGCLAVWPSLSLTGVLGVLSPCKLVLTGSYL